MLFNLEEYPFIHFCIPNVLILCDIYHVQIRQGITWYIMFDTDIFNYFIDYIIDYIY